MKTPERHPGATIAVSFEVQAADRADPPWRHLKLLGLVLARPRQLSPAFALEPWSAGGRSTPRYCLRESLPGRRSLLRARQAAQLPGPRLVYNSERSSWSTSPVGAEMAQVINRNCRDHFNSGVDCRN